MPGCPSGLCPAQDQRCFGGQPSRDLRQSTISSFAKTGGGDLFRPAARNYFESDIFGTTEANDKKDIKRQLLAEKNGSIKLKCFSNKGFPGIKDGPYARLISECGGGYPDFISRFGPDYFEKARGRRATGPCTYLHDRYLNNVPNPISSRKASCCTKSGRPPTLYAAFCGIGGGGCSDFIGGNGVGPYRTHVFTNVMRGELCGLSRPDVIVDSYGKRSELGCGCGRKFRG